MSAGKTKTVGKGWVARWNDGNLGWFLPDHLSGCGWAGANRPNRNENLRGEPVFLCDIIVRQRFDKLGRPIVRYVPPVEG